MSGRGIQGVTMLEGNAAAVILGAPREGLACIVEASAVSAKDVASALFTAAHDLRAALRAQAAGELDWRHAALLEVQEILLPGNLPPCARVLMHWNSEKPQAAIRHEYLYGVASLRANL